MKRTSPPIVSIDKRISFHAQINGGRKLDRSRTVLMQIIEIYFPEAVRKPGSWFSSNETGCNIGKLFHAGGVIVNLIVLQTVDSGVVQSLRGGAQRGTELKFFGSPERLPVVAGGFVIPGHFLHCVVGVP